MIDENLNISGENINKKVCRCTHVQNKIKLFLLNNKNV